MTVCPLSLQKPRTNVILKTILTNQMNKSALTALLMLAIIPTSTFAQHNGLTDVSNSKYATIVNTPLGSTQWTNGFWGERFGVWSNKSIWDMWDVWKDPKLSHGFENFRKIGCVWRIKSDTFNFNVIFLCGDNGSFGNGNTGIVVRNQKGEF